MSSFLRRRLRRKQSRRLRRNNLHIFICRNILFHIVNSVFVQSLMNFINRSVDRIYCAKTACRQRHDDSLDGLGGKEWARPRRDASLAGVCVRVWIGSTATAIVGPVGAT